MWPLPEDSEWPQATSTLIASLNLPTPQTAPPDVAYDPPTNATITAAVKDAAAHTAHRLHGNEPTLSGRKRARHGGPCPAPPPSTPSTKYSFSRPNMMTIARNQHATLRLGRRWRSLSRCYVLGTYTHSQWTLRRPYMPVLPTAPTAMRAFRYLARSHRLQNYPGCRSATNSCIVPPAPCIIENLRCTHLYVSLLICVLRDSRVGGRHLPYPPLPTAMC